MKDTLSIVISVFNEEDNIDLLYKELVPVLDELSLKSVEVIWVDDGSTDCSLKRMQSVQKKDKRFKIVRLTRNFGHEAAMTAGMNHATGDGVIFMDADLQHPPRYIPEMVRLWQDGHDIVLTRREDNLSTSRFYKMCAKIFYKILNWLSDTEIPEKMPDFRLVDRKYVNFLKEFGEQQRLFRGILSYVASTKSAARISFIAPERVAGKSKYTFVKCLGLAIDSIVQFSVKPLYLSLIVAVITALLAMGLGLYVVLEHFILSRPDTGYATLMVTIVSMGSMNMLMFGILGAYIARIHLETKKRPLYFAEMLDVKEDKNATGNRECR